MKNNFGTGDLEDKQALNYRITSQKVDEFVTVKIINNHKITMLPV